VEVEGREGRREGGKKKNETKQELYFSISS
jgi:hypothetical protein